MFVLKDLKILKEKIKSKYGQNDEEFSTEKVLNDPKFNKKSIKFQLLKVKKTHSNNVPSGKKVNVKKVKKKN